MEQSKTIAFHTLGCKLNFSETSTISRLFEQNEFEKKDFHDVADVYVINTCSVTETADKECKQLIKKAKKTNPNATVVVTGCYAQLKPEHIAKMKGVDIVIGANEKFNIVQHVQQFQTTHEPQIYSCEVDEIEGFNSSFSLNDRTRTFLKVQDGCDYSCTFCTIPLARGHSRSNTIQGVLDNVKELSNIGVQEIVLTGVNLGDFGKGYNGSKNHNETFFDLVKTLETQTNIPRYRISSIEPNLLTDEIIEYVAQSKRFMPHFHIPLQSGSNQVLGNMRRRYRRDVYQSRVEKIKSLIPHCCIGVDVIVGFPGETEELFQETYQFLKTIDISYLHVFTYSERENTIAKEMNHVVPYLERKRRNSTLRNLSEKKMNYFIGQQHGQKRPVLFEHAEKKGMIEGYTDNYIKISQPYDETKINKIINVEISTPIHKV
ncbi:MAG TPA: tRNA (N(6)-L-threonylcarbamoyladenosine(37)-C(2))-methylthiotransferase MtaB [Chitinophagaceae bacterium]|nr:tRNA (N(6)-L-threonylcarbamoyladenosine(37)-C(2))-methylthiotransferase MtaB [Chitinophagaceae bacterium]